MKTKKESVPASYLPVAWVYREVIEEEIARHTRGKIFYFCEEAVCSAEGKILGMEEAEGQGIFIHLEPEKTIRIDRIITLFGKPGAAYDEYNAYADACMECMGGQEKDSD